MRTEEIFAFIAVVQIGSFSSAAEKIFVSQPTISRYVSNLEKELGSALLVRYARSCELTDFGKKVFPHMLRIQYETERVYEVSRIDRNPGSKAIHIGYTYEAMLPFISDALADADFPFKDLEIKLRFDTGSALADLLRNHRIDCAVMHLPSLDDPRELDVQLLKRTKMGVVVSEKHPLAQQKQVFLKQIRNELYIRHPKEKNYYETADDVFRHVGKDPIRHVDIDSQHEGMISVRYKGCVALNPIMYPAWPGCRSVEIEDWTADCSLILVTRQDESSNVLQAFYKSMQNVFQRQGTARDQE